MTLLAKQARFVEMIAQLITWAYSHGYTLTFGEAFRDSRWAAILAKMGLGIAKSLHSQRLAVDFNLFKNGIYLTKTVDYEPLGEYWESLGGSWGGRFSRADGNHFSLEYNGIK